MSREFRALLKSLEIAEEQRQNETLRTQKSADSIAEEQNQAVREERERKENIIWEKLQETRSYLANIYASYTQEPATWGHNIDVYNTAQYYAIRPQGRTHNIYKLSRLEGICLSYDIDKAVYQYYKLNGARTETYINGGHPYNGPNIKIEQHSDIFYESSPLEFTDHEEIKRQFLLDLRDAYKQHVKRKRAGLTKTFIALSLTGGLLYACAADAAEFPANDQPLPGTSISFEP